MISGKENIAFKKALGTLNKVMKDHNLLAQSDGRIIFFDTQDYVNEEELFGEGAKGIEFHPEAFGNKGKRKQSKTNQCEDDCQKAIEQALGIISKSMKKNNISVYSEGKIDFFKIEDCNEEDRTYSNGYEFYPSALIIN